MRLTAAAFERHFGLAWHTAHAAIKRLLAVDSVGAAPADAPLEVGEQRDDTVNGNLYEAAGPASTDWVKIARRAQIITQSLDVASVAANTTAEQTFTVTGLAVGDAVIVNKPALNAGLGVCNARVSAANTLALTFNNNTAGAIDPAAETYTIIVFKK